MSCRREVGYCVPWGGRAADIGIHQQELMQLCRIQHTRRPNRLLATARRLRSRISVKRRSRHVSATRPPADAAAFVRVGFRRDDALSRRSASSAEARATQIEAAPKKVDRAHLANEPRAKFLQHNLG